MHSTVCFACLLILLHDFRHNFRFMHSNRIISVGSSRCFVLATFAAIIHHPPSSSCDFRWAPSSTQQLHHPPSGSQHHIHNPHQRLRLSQPTSHPQSAIDTSATSHPQSTPELATIAANNPHPRPGSVLGSCATRTRQRWGRS
jgi:hypothetical protein